MTKRLFIGTKIDSKIFEYVYPEIKDAFEHAADGKWVEPENMHFTYKFLGDTNVELIPEILSTLGDILTYPHDSSLSFKGLGVFPNLRRARVLYAHIINSDNKIVTLQKEIEHRLHPLGFEPEDREFKPHLTLMRIKKAYNSEFKDAINRYRDYNFGEMEKFSIDLIESKLTPKGPIYTVLSQV